MNAAQSGPGVLLVDNGSLETAAIFKLRALAETMSSRLQRPVEPVSLLHSNRVPAEQLGGRAAEVLEPALRRRLQAGRIEFALLPLFIGPTRALTEQVPQTVTRLQAEYPELKVRVAAPLHGENDGRLAEILEAQVAALLAASSPSGERLRVALVDHGSPVRAVTAVRDRLAAQLAQRLGDRVAAVAPCSMERRPEPEYDFNEPLLERLLTTPSWNEGTVIVAQLFLLPGRHAGPAGDIAQICHGAEAAAGGRLHTVRTGLLGDHPRLPDILADRYRALRA